MQFRFVEGFFVGVHRADGPTAAEWTAHCAHLHRRRHEIRGVIIFSAGGGPSSKQRGELRDAVMGQAGPSQVAAFAPEDFSEACAFVQGQTEAVLPAQLVLETLRSLAVEIGQPLPAALSYGDATTRASASGY